MGLVRPLLISAVPQSRAGILPDQRNDAVPALSSERSACDGTLESTHW